MYGAIRRGRQAQVYIAQQQCENQVKCCVGQRGVVVVGSKMCRGSAQQQCRCGAGNPQAVKKAGNNVTLNGRQC